MKKIFFFALLTVSLIFSCGVNTSVNLKKDGSGSVSFYLRLEKPVLEYYRDMAELSGNCASREEIVVFDTTTIRGRLVKFPGITIGELRATKEGELFVSLSFKNINALLQSSGSTGLGKAFTFIKGAENTISVKFDKTVIEELLTLFMAENDPGIRDYLPQEGESREEYYSNLEFVIDNAAALVKNSVISVSIAVDGTVLRHNGILQNASTVRFATTLDNLLFLTAPQMYYVTFQ